MSDISVNNDYPIDPNFMALSVRGQFSETFIRNNEALLLELDEDKAIIGITDPSKSDLIDMIRQSFVLSGHQRVDLSLVPIKKSDILRFLSAENRTTQTNSQEIRSDFALDSLANEAPIISLLNGILLSALRAAASDVHLEATDSGGVVRLRLDGVLEILRRIQPTEFLAISSRIKLVSHLNIMERRLPQDGRFSATIDNRPFDIRVSIVPTIHGESLVLRILEQNRNPIGLREIGYTENQLSSLLRLTRTTHGLVLVTGPTGSGKTTTLNALLKEIHENSKKIITIEDPVEIRLQGIEQIQINESIGLTFPSILRRILRQDPDIIMVGEIRDSETAQLAVRAALTGHLVLATLHTNSSIEAVERLLDMEIPAYLVAAVLRGIVAQRLVRRTCPECSGNGAVQSKPAGCTRCHGTGYRGRLALAEILEVEDGIRRQIHRGKGSQDLLEIAKKTANFHPMTEAGKMLIEKGITDEAELLRVLA